MLLKFKNKSIYFNHFQTHHSLISNLSNTLNFNKNFIQRNYAVQTSFIPTITQNLSEKEIQRGFREKEEFNVKVCKQRIPENHIINCSWPAIKFVRKSNELELFLTAKQLKEVQSSLRPHQSYFNIPFKFKIKSEDEFKIVEWFLPPEFVPPKLKYSNFSEVLTDFFNKMPPIGGNPTFSWRCPLDQPLTKDMKTFNWADKTVFPTGPIVFLEPSFTSTDFATIPPVLNHENLQNEFFIVRWARFDFTNKQFYITNAITYNEEELFTSLHNNKIINLTLDKNRDEAIFQAAQKLSHQIDPRLPFKTRFSPVDFLVAPSTRVNPKRYLYYIETGPFVIPRLWNTELKRVRWPKPALASQKFVGDVSETKVDPIVWQMLSQTLTINSKNNLLEYFLNKSAVASSEKQKERVKYHYETPESTPARLGPVAFREQLIEDF
eukprot:TRINITY_DN1383_c0_g3_i1.p1 TRINITY_DN1383_c0_g3~~TRINITY_DN1383_c0_g3_i1.p1  ORF type:complete len:436 (+),score=159.39 TRINITY_DN1383_c0_g3_i1:64-1371(+)